MMKKLLVAVMTFSLVALVAAPVAAQATGTDPGASSPGIAASGAGVLKKAQFRSEPAQLNFTGLTNLISDTVVLTVSGCILTEFHSEMCQFGTGENGASTQVRTLIGGVLGEGHSVFGFVFISPDGNSNGLFDVSGYNSWRCGLAPGTYSIFVQGAQAIGGTSCVRGRTLTTSWKK
jgi:opacity protein-like surface antigen